MSSFVYDDDNDNHHYDYWLVMVLGTLLNAEVLSSLDLS